MAIDLADYQVKTKDSIRAFWGNRDAALQKHLEAGNAEQEWRNTRPGKNMVGFIALMIDIVKANGLEAAEIHTKSGSLALPGYFRPTKFWDLLVFFKGRLIAALEIKSQTGPSFGNNFNSRIEQTVGSAHDFWTAYREGYFGNRSRPFLGWLMLVEDAPESHSSIKEKSPHVPISEEFKGVSYIKRYDLLCQKLIREQLFSAATVIASPKHAINTGEYSSISNTTSLTMFVTLFAEHIATTAATL
ncbi:MAG: restriction endonuclease [Chlorobiaceae bacterium]|nr:restriction endonuclease [Chlorobiaceae bacterium]